MKLTVHIHLDLFWKKSTQLIENMVNENSEELEFTWNTADGETTRPKKHYSHFAEKSQ